MLNVQALVEDRPIQCVEGYANGIQRWQEGVHGRLNVAAWGGGSVLKSCGCCFLPVKGCCMLTKYKSWNRRHG